MKKKGMNAYVAKRIRKIKKGMKFILFSFFFLNKKNYWFFLVLYLHKV